MKYYFALIVMFFISSVIKASSQNDVNDKFIKAVRSERANVVKSLLSTRSKDISDAYFRNGIVTALRNYLDDQDTLRVLQNHPRFDQMIARYPACPTMQFLQRCKAAEQQ